MSKFDATRLVDGVPLRERYERFCGTFVETKNRMHSYRLAFVVDKDKTADWVNEQALKLMADPEIMARIQEMRDTAARATLVGVQELIQDYVDIIHTDVNEIVCHARENCRFCHGVDHHYQWSTPAEYEAALDKALALEQPAPDMFGGFGFDAKADPSPTCPSCYGRGVGAVHVADTRKLSPQAKKLIKSIREDRFGVTTVELHDKQAARAELLKVLGAFKDGMPPVVSIVPPAPPISADATEAEAAKSYLRLISAK